MVGVIRDFLERVLGGLVSNGMLGKELMIMPVKTLCANKPSVDIEIWSFKYWRPTDGGEGASLDSHQLTCSR